MLFGGAKKEHKNHTFSNRNSKRIRMTTSLQSRTWPVQGQNRVFPMHFSHTGKNLFTLAGIPVMKTGFPLLGKVHRENPVFITGMGLQCRHIDSSS